MKIDAKLQNDQKTHCFRLQLVIDHNARIARQIRKHCLNILHQLHASMTKKGGTYEVQFGKHERSDSHRPSNRFLK